jgi:hypothetical protein
MNRRTAILLTAFLILMYPVAAYAEPTVNGPSGLFVNPTADIAPTEHMWVGLNFIDLDTIILPDQSVEGGTVWTGVLTGGIADNFEIGLGFTVQEESSNGMLLNAKYLIIPEVEDQWYPALALGGMLKNYSGNKDANIYLVGSKFFWVAEEGYYGGSLHFGLDYAKPEGDEWDLQLFAGADMSFTEDLIAIFEWHEDEGGFGHGWTYGVRYYFSDNTTGQAGFIDGDLTIGGSYIF